VSALHAEAKSEAWVECQSRIHSELNLKGSESSVTVLPRILEKIPVLLFAGDQDLICNYVGQESLIQSLTWNGGTGLGVCTETFLPSQPPGLTVSVASGNSNLDCCRHACWYLGFLEEFDICQGSIIPLGHNCSALNRPFIIDF
jgi:hypothetical protein